MIAVPERWRRSDGVVRWERPERSAAIAPMWFELLQSVGLTERRRKGEGHAQITMSTSKAAAERTEDVLKWPSMILALGYFPSNPRGRCPEGQ